MFMVMMMKGRNGGGGEEEEEDLKGLVDVVIELHHGRPPFVLHG